MFQTDVNSLIKDLDTKIGNRSFITVRELVSFGIFGSLPSVRLALKEGRLPSIKISPRRFVIPRQELFNFLRNNLDKK